MKERTRETEIDEAIEPKSNELSRCLHLLLANKVETVFSYCLQHPFIAMRI